MWIRKLIARHDAYAQRRAATAACVELFSTRASDLDRFVLLCNYKYHDYASVIAVICIRTTE